jgi:hypothetical protein
MTEKCAACGKPIEIVFLEKIRGTYLRNSKGKRRAICGDCQKNESLDALRAKL